MIDFKETSKKESKFWIFRVYKDGKIVSNRFINVSKKLHPTKEEAKFRAGKIFRASESHRIDL